MFTAISLGIKGYYLKSDMDKRRGVGYLLIFMLLKMDN